MDVTGKRLLVIGANGVLGVRIAEQLAHAGADVLGTARSDASSLPNGIKESFTLDLEKPASVAALVDDLLTSEQPLDGVIVATGVVAFGSAVSTPADVTARLMQVNFLGPAAVISGVLPLLTASAEAARSPFILAIPGIVAERAFPNMAAYVASKSALHAWLSALRTELRRPLVRVIDARPGHTETGLAGRAIFGVAPAFPSGMEPAHVADIIVNAIQGDATDLPSTAF